MDAGLHYNDGSWKLGSPIWKVSFLHSYPILIFVGMIFTMIIVIYYWKRYKYSWNNLYILFLISLPASLISAKLYTLIIDGGWGDFLNFSGLSIYGGIFGGILAGGIYLTRRKYSLDFRTVFSITLPPLLIGQAIGRWGNFTNHEIYGFAVSKESLAWMTVLRPHMFIEHAYRAPIFLYESLANLVAYLIIVPGLFHNSKVKPGTAGALYMVFYGFIRLVLQTQRDAGPDGQNTSFIWGTRVPINLVISAIFMMVGIFLTIMWELNVEWKVKTKSGKIFILWPRQIYMKKEIEPKTISFFKSKNKQFKKSAFIYVRNYNPERWSKRELNRGRKR